MAVAALRADGVEAFLGNAYHDSVMAIGTHALGGLQVMVPSMQLAEAKALLAARRQQASGDDAWDDDAEDGGAPRGRRDRWKAWLLALFFIGPIGAGLIALVVVGFERWGGVFRKLFGG